MDIHSDWKKKLPQPKSNDKIVGYIYETYEYSKFNTTDYNREISPEHVEKLKASFADKDLGIASPVKTNEHIEVIDGGHTLEARREAHLPLYHIIVEGTSAEEDIARLNMDRKPWNYEDWIKHYVTRHRKSNNEEQFYNYILLQDFRERHKFSLGVQLNLFCLNANDTRNYSDLKKGILSHTDPDESEYVATWMGMACEIIKERRRDFVKAMWFVYRDENINNDKFIAQLERKKNKVDPSKKNTEAWIKWIDDAVLDKTFMKGKGNFTGPNKPLYLSTSWINYQDINQKNKRRFLKEENKK